MKFAIIDNGEPAPDFVLKVLCNGACVNVAVDYVIDSSSLLQAMLACWAPRCPESCQRCRRWRRCIAGKGAAPTWRRPYVWDWLPEAALI